MSWRYLGWLFVSTAACALALAACTSRSAVDQDAGPRPDAMQTGLARPDVALDARDQDLVPDRGLDDLVSPPDMGPPPDGFTCTPLAHATPTHKALHGHCGCYGVPFNRVITSAAQLKSHVAHYCAGTFCNGSPPSGPCPAPPAVDFSTQTLLYAYGMSSSGCQVAYSIDEVLHCGSHLRVHYTAGGYDTTPLTCEAYVQACASALVAKTSLPVYFIRSTWTN